jgi:hypothetical protein
MTNTMYPPTFGAGQPPAAYPEGTAWGPAPAPASSPAGWGPPPNAPALPLVAAVAPGPRDRQRLFLITTVAAALVAALVLALLLSARSSLADEQHTTASLRTKLASTQHTAAGVRTQLKDAQAKAASAEENAQAVSACARGLFAFITDVSQNQQDKARSDLQAGLTACQRAGVGS